MSLLVFIRPIDNVIDEINIRRQASYQHEWVFETATVSGPATISAKWIGIPAPQKYTDGRS